MGRGHRGVRQQASEEGARVGGVMRACDVRRAQEGPWGARRAFSGQIS